MEKPTSLTRLTEHLRRVGARAVYQLDVETGVWVAYAARSNPTNMPTSIRLAEGPTIEAASERAMASVAATPRFSRNVHA